MWPVSGPEGKPKRCRNFFSRAEPLNKCIKFTIEGSSPECISSRVRVQSCRCEDSELCNERSHWNPKSSHYKLCSFGQNSYSEF